MCGDRLVSTSLLTLPRRITQRSDVSATSSSRMYITPYDPGAILATERNRPMTDSSL